MLLGDTLRDSTKPKALPFTAGDPETADAPPLYIEDPDQDTTRMHTLEVSARRLRCLETLIDWAYDGNSDKVMRFLKDERDCGRMMYICKEYGLEFWYDVAQEELLKLLQETKNANYSFQILNLVYQSISEEKRGRFKEIGKKLVRQSDPVELVELLGRKDWLVESMREDLKWMVGGLTFSVVDEEERES